MRTYKNIDEYILQFPDEVQMMLEQIRKTIQDAAPMAREVISYSMPAFRLKRVLVYFAAYQKHIGFYPTSSPIVAFNDELSGFKVSKGTIQFPLDKEIPFDLITRIVHFRVLEDTEKAKS